MRFKLLSKIDKSYDATRVIKTASTLLVLFWRRERALLIIILLNLGLPFYFGVRGGGLLVPLVCSAAMTINAILMAWRALMDGDLPAAPIGMTFASAMILPGIYFIGRWIGDAASGPMSFTAQELIAVVLVIGAALMQGRGKNEEPADAARPLSNQNADGEKKLRALLAELEDKPIQKPPSKYALFTKKGVPNRTPSIIQIFDETNPLLLAFHAAHRYVERRLFWERKQPRVRAGGRFQREFVNGTAADSRRGH